MDNEGKENDKDASQKNLDETFTLCSVDEHIKDSVDEHIKDTPDQECELLSNEQHALCLHPELCAGGGAVRRGGGGGGGGGLSGTARSPGSTTVTAHARTCAHTPSSLSSLNVPFLC